MLVLCLFVLSSVALCNAYASMLRNFYCGLFWPAMDAPPLTLCVDTPLKPGNHYMSFRSEISSQRRLLVFGADGRELQCNSETATYTPGEQLRVDISELNGGSYAEHLFEILSDDAQFTGRTGCDGRRVAGQFNANDEPHEKQGLLTSLEKEKKNDRNLLTAAPLQSFTSTPPRRPTI